jgi:hypothetical protein
VYFKLVDNAPEEDSREVVIVGQRFMILLNAVRSAAQLYSTYQNEKKDAMKLLSAA